MFCSFLYLKKFSCGHECCKTGIISTHPNKVCELINGPQDHFALIITVFPWIHFPLELYSPSNSICSILPYEWNNDRPRIVFAVSACAVYAKRNCCWCSIPHFPATGNCWDVSSPLMMTTTIKQTVEDTDWLHLLFSTTCLLYVKKTCDSHLWTRPFKLHC